MNQWLYCSLLVIGSYLLGSVSSAILVTWLWLHKDIRNLGNCNAGKNHSITLAISMTTFGGLAPLPAAFSPIVQIPLMILILKIARRLQTEVYCAHPYASGERGINENTNGLIRQYVPKTDNFPTSLPIGLLL